MPTNDFLALATGGGANVESQAAYAADTQLPLGSQPGVARSAFVNKTLRQTSYVVANLAQFICNVTGLNMNDDATPANILAALAAAFKTAPTFQKFLAGSGTYTPTSANVLFLRVKMVGGGGGGWGGTGGGATGGNTTFGAGLLVANGGSFGLAGGGTFSLGAAVGWGQTGGVSTIGGPAGGTPLGNGGMSAAVASAPAVNSGAGGAGNNNTGANGCGGGYIEAIVPYAASFAYTVGAGGAVGTGGLGGTPGAAGAIYIEECYQ
jgi:hypothetical protein